MDKIWANEIAFYDVRKPNKHGQYFGLMDRGIQQTVSLVKSAFEHHRAVFRSEDVMAGDKQLLLVPDCIEQEPWVHALFYNKYYVPVATFRGMDTSEERDQITSDEFCNVITRDFGSDHNNIFYLTGPIGCGKTAFLNKILSCEAANWLSKDKLLFVRITGFEMERKEVRSRDVILNYLITKTLRVVDNEKIVQGNNAVWNALSELRNSPYFELTPKRLRDFVTFIRLLRVELKTRMLFVIDNMDYIFYLDDVRLFYPDFVGRPLANTTVIDIVNAIRDKNELGCAGANVLLVLRTPSYEMLRNTLEKTGEADWGGGHHLDESCFAISEASVKDVIEARLGMIKELQEVYLPAGSYRYVDPIVSAVRVFSSEGDDVDKEKGDDVDEGEASLIDVLSEISTYRIRDIMNFCATYAWIYGIEDQYERGIDRFLQHFHAGLIAFILNGRKRYSQQHTRFPNLYLNAQLSELDSEIQQQERHGFPNYYWLKRLLIEYINERDGAGKRVTLGELSRVFSSGDKKYPERVVYHALTSLGRTNSSNILHVETSYFSGKFEGQVWMSLSKRGSHCLREVFDTFAYMQLIIDDYDLPIPADDRIFSLFKYSDLDYSYLVEKGDYYSTLLQIVRDKVVKVACFLEILKYELEYEMNRFSSTFKELEKMGVHVDFAKIQKRIHDGIVGILIFSKMDVRRESEIIEKKRSYAEKILKELYEALLDETTASSDNETTE